MNNKLCQIHNEPALFCEEDAQQNQVFLCRLCVQQKFKIKNIDDVDYEEKQALKQLETQFDQSIKQLKDFAKVLEKFTQQIQMKLKKFKQLVEQSISHIIEKKNYVIAVSNNFANLQILQINEQKSIIKNLLPQIIIQLNNQIIELEICIKFDQLYQQLKNFQVEEKSNIKLLDDIRKFKVIDKKFDYQLMQQSSDQLYYQCQALAFNNDSTIMIAGCEYLIKVFEFKNEKLTELQQLTGHSKRVICFQFMKLSNQFISGGEDSNLIIWEYNQNYQWLCNQILKGHKFSVKCITMSQKEDMIISGSSDYTIKFWQKSKKTWKFWQNQEYIWSLNQSIDCQSQVYSVSLNELEDNLIASVNDEILVIQLQGRYWKIKQILDNYCGYKLCFINQNQFVFQPRCGYSLKIFHYVAKDETYQQGQELSYNKQEYDEEHLFPIQYISHIGLIIVKSANHVQIIKRNYNGQFTVEQSINFKTKKLIGCITNDAQYISTWDSISQKIQIWKFEF